MTVQSNPINIQMDSFEPGAAIDLRNLSYTATAQYSSDGNLSMDVLMSNSNSNNGSSSKSSFDYTQVSRGIDNIVDYVPKTKSSSSSYGFESMQINFDMRQLQGGLPNTDNIDTSFLPPDLELKVVEMPKVIIKYVGGPLYIPRSADPSYVPPEEFNQIFDGKSNFDVKA
jgi:hypothetical protein